MKRYLFALVAATALTLAACGGDDGGRGNGNGGKPATECADLSADDPFTVRMVDNAFEPSCFTARSEATITVINEGALPHTFTIPGTQVDVTVQPGETFNGESAGLAPGNYDLLCTLHPEMTGTIEVV
jgi:plastocyanin